MIDFFINPDLPKKYKSVVNSLYLLVILILFYNIPTNQMGFFEYTKVIGAELGFISALFLAFLTETSIFICAKGFFSFFVSQTNRIVTFILLFCWFLATFVSGMASLGGLENKNKERVGDAPEMNMSRIDAINAKYDLQISKLQDKYGGGGSLAYDNEIANLTEKISELQGKLKRMDKTSVNAKAKLSSEITRLEFQKSMAFRNKQSENVQNSQNLALLSNETKEINELRKSELAQNKTSFEGKLATYNDDLEGGNSIAYWINIFIVLFNFLLNMAISCIDKDFEKENGRAFLWLFGKKNDKDIQKLVTAGEEVQKQLKKYTKDDYQAFFDSHYQQGMRANDFVALAKDKMKKGEHFKDTSLVVMFPDFKKNYGDRLLAKEHVESPKNVPIQEPLQSEPIEDVDTEEEDKLKTKAIKLYNLGNPLPAVLNQLGLTKGGEIRYQIAEYVKQNGDHSKQRDYAIKTDKKSK